MRDEIRRLEARIQDETIRMHEIDPDHTLDPKLQRCSACHAAIGASRPAAGAIAIVAYLDPDASDAREAVRVL